jgi:hypothetical protein
VWDWVHLVRRPLFGLLYQPWMMDDDECGVIGGIIGRGNQSTLKKRAPVPLCPPYITYDLIRTRIRVSAVPSRRRLTTWVTARPYSRCFWVALNCLVRAISTLLLFHAQLHCIALENLISAEYFIQISNQSMETQTKIDCWWKWNLQLLGLDNSQQLYIHKTRWEGVGGKYHVKAEFSSFH